MKLITGLLVGATILAAGVAEAQYYSPVSVSGQVLSYGPLGFMIQGPDGNYGIVVNGGTVTTDPWNGLVTSGPVSIQPGQFITATGYPTGQWTMQASSIVEGNGAPAPVINSPYNGYYPSYGYPTYGTYYGSPTILPNGGIIGTPTTLPYFPGMRTLNSFPLGIGGSLNLSAVRTVLN